MNNDGKKKRGLTPIGNILSGSLPTLRSEGDAGMTKVWSIWESAVGNDIAENARPEAFKGGTLLVHVTNSTWLQHLGFLKKEMAQKINAALGQEVVTELKFKIGNLTGGNPFSYPARPGK